MSVKFAIAGEPVGKGRHRVRVINGKVSTYTPDKTRHYEDVVMTCYGCNLEAPDYGRAPVALTVNAYFGMPESASKKKRAQMIAGEIRPTKKPDWDNLGKIISDALNGLAYNDDCQIVEAHVYKYYAEEPRVEVELASIEMEK